MPVLLGTGSAFVRFPVGLNALGGILTVVPFTEPVLLSVAVIGPVFVVPGGTLIMLPGGKIVPVLLFPGDCSAPADEGGISPPVFPVL